MAIKRLNVVEIFSPSNQPDQWQVLPKSVAMIQTGGSIGMLEALYSFVDLPIIQYPISFLKSDVDRWGSARSV